MFYSVSLGQTIVDLVSGTSIITFACISVGLMFIISEFFHSAKGVFAGIGTALATVGIIIRMLMGGTAGMLFVMLFGIVFVLLVAHVLMLSLHKKPWLVQSLKLALTQGGQHEKTNYSYLVELSGVAATDIDGTGSLSINDVTFFVHSQVRIEKGSFVKVVAVDNEKIYVEEIG